MKKTPNLFHYATSELSQDAFISWLLAWADESQRTTDPPLNQAGRSLLRWMLKQNGITLSESPKVEMKRQHEKIDILAVVDDTIVLVIEDKTATQQHSVQLMRYRKIAERNPDWAERAFIYLQTGDQCDYRTVHHAGYHTLGRCKLLELLKQHPKCIKESHIYRDFVEYLQRIEDEVQEYQTKKISDWGGRQWTGFFTKVQTEKGFENAGWGYVPNAAGGFWGIWFGGSEFRLGDVDDNQKVSLYCLLEGGRFRFKISVPIVAYRRTLADFWSQRLVAIGKERGIDVRRPRAIRSGGDMSICHVYEDKPCLVTDAKRCLNFAETMNRIRVASQFLLDAIKTVNEEEWRALLPLPTAT